MIIWAFALLVAIILLVPETYRKILYPNRISVATSLKNEQETNSTLIDPILIREKAKTLRESTGDTRWMAPCEKTKRSLYQTVSRSLRRPFELLFFEPICLSLCIYSAILLGILYLFFGAFPIIFTALYKFTLWQVGLSFLGIAVGLVIGTLSDPLWVRIRTGLLEKNQQSGVGKPELHLPPAIAGSIIVPMGLFMFAWTTHPSIHWVVPIIGSGLFGAG